MANKEHTGEKTVYLLFTLASNGRVIANPNHFESAANALNEGNRKFNKGECIDYSYVAVSNPPLYGASSPKRNSRMRTLCRSAKVEPPSAFQL